MRFALRVRLLVISTAAVALALEAGAQTNSLAKRGRQMLGHPPAPSSQPAARSDVILGGPPADLGPASSNAVNPVLLAISPIAVEVPEPRKIQVHDLVTVIVREDKKSTSDAKLESDKQWQIDAELKKWFRLDLHDRLVPQTFPNGTPGMDFEFNNKYDGEGKIERGDTLTLRITATVLDVRPNGTLVLEARKRIKNDEDVQIMTLTGTCRTEDVTAQNTVLSTQLADAEVVTEHTGPARDAARRGWLMKAFDWLRPF